MTTIQLTADGSHTIYVPELDEHYHSIHGAIRESTIVYIDAALKECKKNSVNILEIGFGTGLNALLSFIETTKRTLNIQYTALELHPISQQDAEMLNYAEQLSPQMQEVFNSLHSSQWNKCCPITQAFTLEKIKTNASNPENIPSEQEYDIIFFDAFAPDKQPEMWTSAIFNKLHAVAANNAILSTYCAKGAVRRMMQSAGFVTERLPGPPGKREILRAKKV